MGVFMISACVEEGPQTGNPEFQECVEATVTAGEQYVLKVEANLDCKVSVPENTFQWFWIQDGSFKQTEVKKKSGSHEIIIGVSEVEEFDTNRSCEVTLSMGGQEQVIARLVRFAKNPTHSVYPAKVEDGEAVFLPDGSGYDYETEEVESLDLYWAGSSYRLPIKVEANYNWRYEGPEWMTIDIPENVEGIQNLIIEGVPTKLPLDDASGKLTFVNGSDVVKEYTVTIPGCRDIFSYSVANSLSELVFNAKGHYKTSSGFIQANPEEGIEDIYFSIYGVDGIRVIALSATSDTYSEDVPTWLHLNVQEYSTSESAEVLQTRKVTVTVDENTGDERGAAIVVLPQSVDVQAADLFDETGIKEEYKQYVVPVKQLSSTQPFVSLLANPSVAAASGARLTTTTDPTLLTKFGETKWAFDLLYNSQYARDNARLVFDAAVTTAEIYDEDAKPIVFEFANIYSDAVEASKEMAAGDKIYVLADELDKENSNVVVAAGGWYEVVEPGKVKAVESDIFALSISIDNKGYNGVIDMRSEEYAVGYVVLKGAEGEVLAVVKCEIDPEVVIGEIPDVEFTVESAMLALQVGATLENVTDNPDFRAQREGNAPLFLLTYTQENQPLSLVIPASVKKHTVNPYAYRYNIRVNDTRYDEDFVNGILGGIELVNGGVLISMDMPDDKKAAKYFAGNIIFTDASDETILKLLCRLDLRNNE